MTTPTNRTEKEKSSHFCACFKKNDVPKKESVDRVHCFATDTIQRKNSDDSSINNKIIRSPASDNLASLGDPNKVFIDQSRRVRSGQGFILSRVNEGDS
jgi:hypothetical protein